MAQMSLPLALLVITTVLGVMMLAIIWSLRRCGLPGVRDWCNANLTATVALALFALRGMVPDLVSIVGANVALSWALAQFYIGAARFCGRAPRLGWLVSGVIGVAAGIVYWHYVSDQFYLRVAVVSMFHAPVCALIGMTLIRHRPRQWPSGRGGGHYLTAGLFALAAAAGHAARGVLSVLRVIEYANGLETQGLNVFFLTLGALVMPALTMSAVLMIHDAMVRRLEAIANTDALTGVLSRKAWEDLARRELTRAEAGGPAPSVLMVDIDRFKSVNDTWGHAAGDAVLQAFATVAEGHLRPGDQLGRMGGEEFVVLLPRATPVQAAAVAERIRAAAEASTLVEGVRYTLSAGVATWGRGDRLEQLTARADAALYRAKMTGRNRVQLDDSPRAHAERAPALA